MDTGETMAAGAWQERDASTLGYREHLDLIKTFFISLKPYRGAFWVGCVFSLLHAGCSMALPWYLKILIDDVLQSQNTKKLLWVLGLIVITVIIKSVFMYIQGYLIAFAGQKTVFAIRNDVYGHIQTLPLQFFERWKAGKIMYRVITDINQMTETITSSIPILLGDVFNFLFAVTAMVLIDWRLSLVAFVTSPLIAWIFHHYGELVQKYTALMKEEVSELNSFIRENVNGIKVVKVFGTEERAKRQFEKINNASFVSMMKSIQFTVAQMPLVDVVGTAGIIAIIGMGAWLIHIHSISAGDLIAFCTYMLIATSPVNRVSITWTELRKGLVSASRVFEIFQVKPAIEDGPDALELDDTPGEVELRGVSFGYRENEPILKDLSVKIPAGTFVAIVGSNGSGKSTLLSLLPRLCEPVSGQVLIDSRDIRSIKVRSLRKLVGFMQQEVLLFSGSIRDNIMFGAPDASFDMVVEAAERAGAHAFIRELPGAYDFLIEEKGMNLSGGQRQLIALARVLIRNPAVLILDEATSQLDQHMESTVYRTLAQDRRGRTTIVVAHRLAAVTGADEIIVLREGHMCECGSHGMLMEHEGVYRSLFLAQQGPEGSVP